MSAHDHEFTSCPRCLNRAMEAHNENVLKLSAAYGTIPEDEYNELRQLVAAGAQIDEDGLRVDWYIDMDDGGVLTMSYECYCKTCGFHREFEHTEVFSLEEET